MKCNEDFCYASYCLIAMRKSLVLSSPCCRFHNAKFCTCCKCPCLGIQPCPLYCNGLCKLGIWAMLFILSLHYSHLFSTNTNVQGTLMKEKGRTDSKSHSPVQPNLFNRKGRTNWTSYSSNSNLTVSARIPTKNIYWNSSYSLLGTS